jgi:hypothetical protein
VRRNLNPWARGSASLLILAMGLTVAQPARAAEAKSARARSLAAAAADRVASMDVTQATTPPAAEAKSSKSFFATPKGIAALVLMAGVTAYTVHSRLTSAIHSPARP